MEESGTALTLLWKRGWARSEKCGTAGSAYIPVLPNPPPPRSLGGSSATSSSSTTSTR